MLKKISKLAGYVTFVTRHLSSRAKEKLLRDFNFVRKHKKISAFALGRDVLYTSVKYNMTPLEFFTLRFYNKPEKDRLEFISARTLRKFQLSMNHPQLVQTVSDKIKFMAHFKDFVHRKWATLEMLQQDQQLAESFLTDGKGKVVLKNSAGQAGKQVKMVDTKEVTYHDLLTLMESGNFNLLEEYVVQHDDLMKLAPRGLNTVRVVSQLHNGEPIIISTSLRLSIYDNVDNLSMGNMVVPVDRFTGIVTGGGTFLDISKGDVEAHPLTGVTLKGFKVPNWEKCIETVKKAALLTPENKSIGWDVAITNNDALLVEGNDSWGYICQIAHQRGLKSILSKYTAAPAGKVKIIKQAAPELRLQ